METQTVDVVVLGSGTAGSNAARAAAAEGAKKVVMVHPENLINTCVEEGCMPSKSVLAGAHQNLPLSQVLKERDEHIVRLLKALTDSFESANFEVVVGTAKLTDDHAVTVETPEGPVTYTASSIVIATGSTPFVPPIPGLSDIGEKLLISDDVVSKKAHFEKVPKRILTIGGGPIGLELSTFFHDIGSEVRVLQRGTALGPFDPEFGDERVRASKDAASFPIILNAELNEVKETPEGLLCSIACGETITEEYFDAILVATGRRANTQDIGLQEAGISFDERKNVVHDDHMQTSVPHIFIAGDVTGHHQILHFAAAMGKIAGYNAMHPDQMKTMDYDKHMLAVSFDQFPSALIGLTETEATKRGVEVITATRNFNSIGLGILKRQEYGMWKVVAEKATGKIIGSQILGPDSSGELIQTLVPIIANSNTFEDILKMTWYHPTYAEILQSLARDLKASS
ncbi:MAG: pyruvate/2-oxoglutarate dehydrogenase complex dihydrolipoamide dehydrogenase (E3) component [Candidatus Azotimanducaceae bacterium]|jgi:pyruvate/2-oxoglutarate dehydrogenase complex dihydrolipoamide dehydrogenase (E3) component